jgi:hypothetical protein
MQDVEKKSFGSHKQKVNLSEQINTNNASCVGNVDHSGPNRVAERSVQMEASVNLSQPHHSALTEVRVELVPRVL